MNPQSYRQKLEAAIEQRDQQLLDELEHIATDSPTTKRLWHEHTLLEQAIDQWVCQLDCAEPAMVVSPQTNTKKARRHRPFILTISSLACLLLVGWIAISGNQASSPPALLATNTGSINITLTNPQSINFSSTTAKPQPLPVPLQSRGLFSQVNHSYDLIEQGRALLPEKKILIVFPEMTNHLSKEVSQTWQKISMLPEEMQQVWEQLQFPTEAEEEKTSPSEKTPTSPESPQRFSIFEMLS